MIPQRAWIGVCIAALALLSFFRLPGHTYLHQDTQIYLPILEHLRDPGVLARDPIAGRPHVSFTMYDEVTLAAAHATGGSLEIALQVQQWITRALGILGVFLVAAAMGLSGRAALLVAAILSLGATIAGPTVLAIEYEPIPRGFALPLLLLAMGLAAWGRDLGAGAAASLAFLYHPPSVVTFWTVYFVLTLWPSKPQVMSRRILGLAPILAGVLVMLVLSRMQHGVVEPQPLFGRIDPELERIQRLRAPYNWVSTWAREWMPYYVALWIVSMAAFWRVRKSIAQDLRFFLAGLPILGLLSVPASYLLIEKLKWIVGPQIQPARALLFVPVVAAILTAVAAIKAVEKGSLWEGALWFLAAYLVPARLSPAQLAIAALLAAVAAAAVRMRARAAAAIPIAAALPFFIVSGPKHARLETPELDQLVAWAGASTPRDSMFLFADARKALDPGVFRARARRAVYVDWKSGGQVNFLRKFANEWWERWQATRAGRFRPEDARRYAALGIDYFVLKRSRSPGRAPVFENAQYAVYALP